MTLSGFLWCNISIQCLLCAWHQPGLYKSGGHRPFEQIKQIHMVGAKWCENECNMSSEEGKIKVTGEMSRPVWEDGVGGETRRRNN